MKSLHPKLKVMRSPINLPEAAALVSVSRVTGNSALFRSPFDHQHYVRLRISTARQTDADGPLSAKENLIEVDMSSAQFAEMITTMNVGCGTPCTIKRVLGKDFAPIENAHDPKQTYKHVASDATQKALDALELAELALGGDVKLTKANIAEMRSALRRAAIGIRDVNDFFVSDYAESLEKVTAAAKTEIASYVAHAGLTNELRLSGDSSEVRQIEGE